MSSICSYCILPLRFSHQDNQLESLRCFRLPHMKMSIMTTMPCPCFFAQILQPTCGIHFQETFGCQGNPAPLKGDMCRYSLFICLRTCILMSKVTTHSNIPFTSFVATYFWNSLIQSVIQNFSVFAQHACSSESKDPDIFFATHCWTSTLWGFSSFF